MDKLKQLADLSFATKVWTTLGAIAFLWATGYIYGTDALAVTFFVFTIFYSIYRILAPHDRVEKERAFSLRSMLPIIVILVISATLFQIAQIREILLIDPPPTVAAVFSAINGDEFWSVFGDYLADPTNQSTGAVVWVLAYLTFHRLGGVWKEILDTDSESFLFACFGLIVGCILPAIVEANYASASDGSFFVGFVSGYFLWLLTIVGTTAIAVLAAAAIESGVEEYSGRTTADMGYMPSNKNSALDGFIALLREAWKIPVVQLVVGAVVLVSILFLLWVLLLGLLAAVSVAAFPVLFILTLAADNPPGYYVPNGIFALNVFIAALVMLWRIHESIKEWLGWSMLSTWLLLALVLGVLDRSDNHIVRSLDAPNAPIVSQSLVKSFTEWQQSRPEATASAPIYIVAAQGGGIYASYQTAQFLATLQDADPAFADRVFAISAVSGGAVGAGVFASLVATANNLPQPLPDRWYTTKVDEYLAGDFLTPAVVSTLFVDLPLRAMPCVDNFCFESLSRAIALEKTFELRWDETADSWGNPFADSIGDLSAKNNNVPGLLLNTTEVESGESVVLSNIGTLEDTDVRWFANRAPDINLRLSTAVGLSARFPFLSPAASYDTSDDIKRRLVDGGYYDNSGVLTALAVMDAIRPHTENEVVLIALTSEKTIQARIDGSYILGELLSPLRTFENTRAARARLAIEDAHKSLDGELCEAVADQGECFATGNMRSSTINTSELPLGWHLGVESRRSILRNIGDTSQCVDRGSDWNSCLLSAILNELD